jgi:hypothetical protein
MSDSEVRCDNCGHGAHCHSRDSSGAEFCITEEWAECPCAGFTTGGPVSEVRAAMRKRHSPNGRGGCRFCGQAYPCDTTLLLDALRMAVGE